MRQSNYTKVSVIKTPEPLDVDVDVPCTMSYLTTLLDFALSNCKSIWSSLFFSYQLYVVGLRKPKLIRTFADEIGPNMPTIRYGEAEHPGPVSIRKRILNKFGQRTFKLDMCLSERDYLPHDRDVINSHTYVKIDETYLTLDEDGCIPLLEKVGDFWDTCEEWKLQIKEWTVETDYYETSFWLEENYLNYPRIMKKTPFDGVITSEYYVIRTAKFNAILIFWILKLKILAKRAVRAVKSCKRFRFQVIMRGIKSFGSKSNLRLLNYLGVWHLNNFESSLKSYLPIE